MDAKIIKLQEIEKIIAKMTNIPVSKISAGEKEKVLHFIYKMWQFCFFYVTLKPELVITIFRICKPIV